MFFFDLPWKQLKAKVFWRFQGESKENWEKIG